ncbi:MAG: recombination regulator RecX [Aromatoleum sp.]|uniref:recombination regulator RecX n=1 Tax=Aromatoleum sp. TaxID=2307007 RepID=UPI002893EDA5|nr:recombination regulator RecX [Aromatoleum sp.]MDT3672928.1 recombination regulator RecX [Aromatoleum sp.]
MSGDLKGKALRMLARREHSRAELARKLAAEGTREDIHAVLDQLERSGLLSDARFAETFVSSRAARVGNARLRHDLRARGIADEVIAAALPAEADSETERAREVWRRKFDAPPVDRADYARQARFLQQRGFAVDIIRKVLKEREE